MFDQATFQKILQDLHDQAPTGGCRTIAGLNGALAAALVALVCRSTIGNKKYLQYEGEMKKILERSQKLEKEFLLLAQKDGEVYQEVVAARALPQETEEEQAKRERVLAEALKRAAMVPMDILRRCEVLVEDARTITLHGNEHCWSDAAGAAIMARSAAESACLNILSNISALSDEDFSGKLRSEQARVLKVIQDIAEESVQFVKSKL